MGKVKSIFANLLTFLEGGFRDFLGIKIEDKLDNENDNVQKNVLNKTTFQLRQSQILENRIVFWHSPTSEYRTGIITREFDNGSVEIRQDAPHSSLIRKRKKHLVMHGRLER